METSIKISYRWSADEMLLLNNLHMRYSPQLRKIRRSSRNVAVFIIVIGVGALCTMGSFDQKWSVFTRGCGFVLAGVSLLAVPPVFMRVFMRRAVLKAYAKKPDRDMAITYQISEDGLSCKSDVGSSDMLWRIVCRVVRSADGFLFYVSDNLIHWLPARGFQEPADMDRLAALAKRKVESYTDEC